MTSLRLQKYMSCFNRQKRLILQVPMRAVILFLFTAVVAVSCSDYNKVFKSKDTGLKYAKAVALYEAKDYTKALTLFDQLRDNFRGNDSMESVYYYTAYCHFYSKDYHYASLFFKDYTENFTRSKKLIECDYMAVYCDYLSIGSYELDQSSTKHVIGELQTFINYYPNSSYAPKCTELIDILRHKLQTKEYEWVIGYLNQGHYRAAATSAQNTLKLYPDIPQKEELEFIAIKAQYLYALNSIEKKKLERFNAALEQWKEYNYINGTKGAYYTDALEVKSKIEKEISKLK